MHGLIKMIPVVFYLLIFWTGSAAAADRMQVFVSVLPQKTFVQQIGRDLVDVQVMVQPGASPATYEPKPRQMARLSKTKLYFAIGVPFENVWLDKIAAANPAMQVVHTDEGVEKLAMAVHHHDGEDADQGHEMEDDGHDGLDPHIWLSPPLVKIQAGHILSALQQADPDHAGQYASYHDEFIGKVNRLDGELKHIFEGKHGLQFMVFHPAWGYFAHAYGLEQVPIEMEGKDPKPAQLGEVIQHARKNHIRVIFVQPQFSTKSATVVAREIGGQVAFADPLAEDWLANLRYVAGKFKAALK